MKKANLGGEEHEYWCITNFSKLLCGRQYQPTGCALNVCQTIAQSGNKFVTLYVATPVCSNGIGDNMHVTNNECNHVKSSHLLYTTNVL